MFIHNIIKIKYVTLGFLPNRPYHLISDDEMFDAFVQYQIQIGDDGDETQHFVPNLDEGFFVYFYPYRPATADEMNNPNHYYPVGEAYRKYDRLIRSICKYINDYRTGVSAEIPDWVYSYMLGVVVGPKSDKMDIHDIIAPLGVDNPDDDFDDKASLATYEESLYYLSRTINRSEYEDIGEMTTDIILDRPATMFGEPHVIKSLRLKQVNL